jgi:hypothetical protein
MQEHSITVSENHPSLLEDLVRFAGYCAPIIVSQDGILIDGYRRYQLDPDSEATEMNVRSIYDAALTINRNTRRWDEIDCFLWSRWADSLGVQRDPYPEALRKAPIEMLRSLANRKLQFGQAVRILETPSHTWKFFLDILTRNIKLNMNETASFLEMTFDLANRWSTKNLADVFDHQVLNPIWKDSRSDPKERGVALLKAMRRLRYPLYQKKSEELAAAWQELHLDQLNGNKSLFLTRGMLEIKIRARSKEEMSKKVGELFESLSEPAWKRIWDE